MLARMRTWVRAAICRARLSWQSPLRGSLCPACLALATSRGATDLAGAVDTVLAQAVVTPGQGLGVGLGPGAIGLGRGSPGHGPEGVGLVVVGPGTVELVSMAQRPFLVAAVKMAPLSISTEARRPRAPAVATKSATTTPALVTARAQRS
jgi:hypothetical protein